MKTVLPLQKIAFFIILGTILLLPLFFLPVTSEYYDFNKNALLIISSSLLLIILTVSFVADKQVRIVRSPLTMPLFFLLAAWVVSAFLRTPNRFDAFFDPGQTGTVIALVIFFYSAINLVRSKRELELLALFTVLSGVLLSVLGILWASNLLPQVLPWEFLKSPVWSPTGSPITSMVFILSLIPFLIIMLVREKPGTKKALGILVAILLTVLSSGLIAYRIFKPGSAFRPVFLSQNTSWAIAMRALEVSPLFGTGPATYVSSFTRFRPISYNLTPTWALRFTSSSNYYLQLLTTVGLTGLVVYLFLVYKTVQLFSRALRSSSESPVKLLAITSTSTALILFALQLFLYPTLSLLFLLIAMLVIATLAFKHLGSSLVHEANIDIVAASDTGARTPILPWVFLGGAVLFLVPALYQFGRVYAAETLFSKALVFAAANEGRQTYDTLISAMRLNPYKDSYRLAYSQTNLLLANSAATKKDLTADERNTITQLIQQSIREAKNAVAVNPNKASNLENLAAVYRNLLNLAEGADVWALASYRQAAVLDPVNPNITINMGGILYAQKNYDEAIRLFQHAVDLKPNHANAYYNLSAAYREKGDFKNALVNMQSVVGLIDRNSPDYERAVSELEELRRRAGETTAAQPQGPLPAGTELEGPSPLPSPIISPPIELPEELGPETTSSPAPTTGTPTPAPTTTPTVQ
ncbi:MAG: Tetratricopeptide [Candidatus Amesbacteria bacterium GW2011_GWC1_47_15]|uniref:Tetratricopeptide n=1 Tax=Candidatus Amesbacteria bacterium GW2011_GWC1_47_15 TaxID=1618364 RepID=A0A0G1S2V7_9BACT|nr:MAG: Tetratricopeptide [Candidatus Amesbacteria bacterium GW2011_GWC1_47_15]